MNRDMKIRMASHEPTLTAVSQDDDKMAKIVSWIESDAVHCGASPQSWYFVEHFWHGPPTVGLILQLQWSPIGNQNFQQKTKQNITNDRTHHIVSTLHSECTITFSFTGGLLRLLGCGTAAAVGHDHGCGCWGCRGVFGLIRLVKAARGEGHVARLASSVALSL